jgi:plasmid stability protein
MKDNYDFSNAERRKFYRKDATLKNRKPAVDQLAESGVRMGDALEALGRTIGLTNEDFETFDRVKYNTPEDF